MSTQEKHHPKFKGVFIPASVWCYEASWNLKVVWMIIWHLSDSDEPCFASNEYIAHQAQISTKAVSGYIAELKLMGWVDDVGFDGRERLLVASIPENKHHQPDNVNFQAASPILPGRQVELYRHNGPAYVQDSKKEGKERAPLGDFALNDAEKSASKPKARKTRPVHPSAVSILDHLNKCAGKAYRPIDDYLVPISQRLSEVDNDVDGVKAMIERQCVIWTNDDKMWFYLRPKTLFAKINFHPYYDERNFPVERKQPASPAKSPQQPLWAVKKDIEDLIEAKRNRREDIRNANHGKDLKGEVGDEYDRLGKEIEALKIKMSQLN